MRENIAALDGEGGYEVLLRTAWATRFGRTRKGPQRHSARGPLTTLARLAAEIEAGTAGPVRPRNAEMPLELPIAPLQFLGAPLRVVARRRGLLFLDDCCQRDWLVLPHILP
jgi:hypothetical protein